VYIKDFSGWTTLKEEINKTTPSPTFKEREIWWCSIGINIGDEIDGKNRYFNRPILIIGKFNKNLFWGVALTTKIKENPFYFKLDVHDKPCCVMLSHLRLYDSKRLHNKMGKVSPHDFEAIKLQLKSLL